MADKNEPVVLIGLGCFGTAVALELTPSRHRSTGHRQLPQTGTGLGRPTHPGRDRRLHRRRGAPPTRCTRLLPRRCRHRQRHRSQHPGHVAALAAPRSTTSDGITVVAVKSPDGTFTYASYDTTLSYDDTILVVGRETTSSTSSTSLDPDDSGQGRWRDTARRRRFRPVRRARTARSYDRSTCPTGVQHASAAEAPARALRRPRPARPSARAMFDRPTTERFTW